MARSARYSLRFPAKGEFLPLKLRHERQWAKPGQAFLPSHARISAIWGRPPGLWTGLQTTVCRQLATVDGPPESARPNFRTFLENMILHQRASGRAGNRGKTRAALGQVRRA